MSDNSQNTIFELQERLYALEDALNNPEWIRLTTEAAQEFSREGLRNVVDLARVMYLKNPLIQRGVSVKQLYVWGQGWTVKAKDEDVQKVIDQFLYDPKNDDVIGSHEARMNLEVDLQVDGNLFFCFFVNQATGRVRVRTINFDEISDVICNPDDAKEPWFYKRQWTAQRFDLSSGAISTEQHTAYYPDWRYTPLSQPSTIGSYAVHWDKPVYHVKVGGFSNWKFGLSEVYDAIDWAAAYKSFLEDWASIVRSLRRFAWQVTTTGGNRGVAAAKAKLNTTLGAGSGVESNPPPITGSVFVGNESTKIAPVSTSGATIAAEDGRRLLLMVAASFGLPETFFGDADIGTLATAKSLDRPTELMMEDRQHLWQDIFWNILSFVLLWSVKAPSGALRGMATVVDDVEDGQHNESLDWGDDGDAAISVEFPPLLQHDIPQMVSATVQAATLGASGTLAGTIDQITLSRMLLTLLGVGNAEEILEEMYPGGELPEPTEPNPENEEPTEPDSEELPERPQAEAMMVDAVRELRDAILKEAA